ncbi:MAG TPA: hypothetical protein VK835_12250 [Bacteroidia bacterium]|nr:hypothetical protein [Bacteroidia bacterium]
MIYAYEHIPHTIEGFHENIAYFFDSLVAKDLAKYDEKQLLKKSFIPIINRSKKLVNALKEITKQYHLLGKKDKKTIKDALKNNVDIKKLCDNTGGYSPVKYVKISDETFKALLKGFLTELWEGYYFVNSIRDEFGTVQEHFTEFKKKQSGKVCPFCGLYPLKPADGDSRNAYDHYIPKAFYPFISVNFQNLFPICHECNSDEKKQIDTLFRGTSRRKVFFPYDTKYNANRLSVSISPKEKYSKKTLKTLLDEIDWEVAIKLAGKSDPRLRSWDEIFNIKNRYKNNLLEYQKTWFEDFILKRYREDMADKLTFKRFKEKLMSDAKGQIKDNPLSILRFVYFNFIFSVSDIEGKLNTL